MLAAVERTHATVVLGPDAQLLWGPKDRLRGLKQFHLVPPVHEEEVNRAWNRERTQVLAPIAQERGERLRAHLARGHGELFVLDLAQAAGVAVDLHVVGRICDRHLNFLGAEQGQIGGFHQSIPTQQSVLA